MSNTEEGPIRPKCSDNRDNDRDGKTDYPDDPGCLSAEIDDESDDCPDGPYCPQCSNGLDDDANGLTDFPNDPGCESAADNFELLENPIACGATLMIKALPANGIASGEVNGSSTSNLASTCGGGGGSPAIAYVMVLTRPKVVVISTEGSGFDTVVDLRKVPCMDSQASLACNDNISSTNKTSKLTRSLPAGVYYIIVEGHSSSDSGPYQLRVDRLNGEGEQCMMESDCGPGLVCRVPHGGTTKICTKPVCSDGLDDDGDGKIDYPNDPGCESTSDADESDDCPDGPNCPDCSDGVDNDGDGFTDYPDDTSCKAAGDTSEACVTSEPIGVINAPIIMGDTTGTTDDYDPVCNSTTTTGAGDLLYRIDVPAMSALNLKIAGYDAVTSLLDSTCGGTPVKCSDPDLMTVTNLAAGRYYFVVDAWTTATGPFTITTSGTIAAGGSCEGVLYQAGAITCEPGFICGGPPGARTCSTQCSDGLDNNGDGKTDYPNDPGCAAPNDNSEDTVCPGPMCPACSDGIDNDGDTKIDWPMDTSCPAAGGTSESCTTSEPIGAIVGPTTTGTTVGATNDFDPTCNSSTTTGAGDVIYSIDVPAMATLNLNLTVNGYDTVHSLLDSLCANTLVCSDPTTMTATNLAAGQYFVVIDGWSTATGAFTINTSGQVAPGGSCEGVLFQSGAITCQPGFLCDGVVGARTCRTQCSDGIDNNGDGRTDYPADPGCSAPTDNSEDTVCPGAMCPACADGLDNDGDTKIDWPMDNSCSSASGPSESCVSTEPIAAIVGPTTTGTTVGATNDIDPTCNSTTGVAPDLTYSIDLPAMATLNLNVTGFDTVTTLFDNSCANSIACSDPPLMTVTNLAAGQYFVSVEAFASGTGSFTIATSGQIAQGGSCEGVLFQSGAITCQPGFVCDGVVGARTCRTQCTDGVDNNGDGKIDYPADPGCSAPNDNSEDTVCPGAMCPACADGLDNDNDGQIDYPMDTTCLAAGGISESCVTSEPIIPITMGTHTGTTAGATNDYKPTCGSTTHTAPDVMYSLDVPPLQSLSVNLTGFDGAHSLLDSTCSPTPIACSDPTNMSLTNVAAGKYFVVVDGWGTASGAYTLTTSGVIAAGASCESPLFTAGVLTCPTGTTCGGTAGSRTCRAQCSDGIDNNGDGKIDFPNDPSCTSLTDNTEVTVCPGVACPVCGNGTDDDGDMTTDFPADFGCTSAAGGNEAFCAIEPNFAGVISAPSTNGTLAGMANNYNQTCQSNTGADVAYSLQLPVVVQTLRIDTLGSTITDTAISLKDSNCGTQLGCDDDSDPNGNLSILTLNNVQPGNYAIQVDSYNANGQNNGPFKLNVRGTVSPGTVCTSPLFASGVLACGSGTTCNAGKCQ